MEAIMAKLQIPFLLGILTLFIFGCTPRVEIAPPTEPITINLNVKIQHEILVKVDKELESMFDEEKGLF